MGRIQDPNLGNEPHTDSTGFIIIPITQLFLCKLLHYMWNHYIFISAEADT